MGAGVNQLLQFFGWDDVALIHNASQECEIALSGIMSEVANKSSAVRLKTEIATDSVSAMRSALRTVKSVARSTSKLVLLWVRRVVLYSLFSVIILCYGWEPSTANAFLQQANSLDMNNEEYVYILPYFLKLSTQKPWPWEDPNLDASTRDGLLKMYHNVLVVRNPLVCV